MPPLAHSPFGDIPGQPYCKHVARVREEALRNAKKATDFYRGDKAAFIQAVEAAAILHDLGKLDDANQEVLRGKSGQSLPVAHEDAGVAELLKLRHSEAAVLVAAHHAGLFSQHDERAKPSGRAFRKVAVADRVDEHLDSYLAAHSAAGCPLPTSSVGSQLHRCGLTRRLALSCLVDADHSDTARHYAQECETKYPATRWAERLEALKSYVAGLPSGATERERQRNALRQLVFDACLAAAVDPAIRACDTPVGSGKTTAVMAHLLRVAQEKKLRHIIVVLPYTNIIKQSVETYRKALVLPGERPEDVVVEHHHQVEFQDMLLRQLTTLWRAPIIVTTAVQFFETLANHRPAALRKLHELPGSAVFVDETHAAILSHLWPQAWKWFETLTNEWGAHLVLASGSLPRFWELREFVDPPKTAEAVPDLMPNTLRAELIAAEQVRITPRRRVEPLDCDSLVRWVLETEPQGPRLVILNTVQSAAVVACRMRQLGHDVLHLSTALAPVHRERIVELVKERLRNRCTGWTLVATSCVEAGMDFSFRAGFRESCSTASLIQVGGRVSRSAEHEGAVVWDFRSNDPKLTQHTGFTVSRRVLDGLFENDQMTTLRPSALATEAMRREVTEGARQRTNEILEAESGMEYPRVAELCRVIEGDTRLVIVDPELVNAIENHEQVPAIRLLRSSVQLRTESVNLRRFTRLVNGMAKRNQELYAWTAAYDPDFLGYMAGVLPLLDSLGKGIFIA